MSTFPPSLRSGLKLVTRNPGFALTAILTLAFGIGSATVVFSMVSAFLLRPMPFHDSQALVHLWATDTAQGWTDVKVSLQNFLDWRLQTRTLEGVEGFYYRSCNISGDATPEQIESSNVTAGMFRLLGVHPQLGRDFQAGEDRPGREPVAILSHRLWQSRFSGSNEVVGQRIRLDGEPFTIVGVMPPDFEFPLKKTQIWMPLVLDETRHSRGEPLLQAVGRLRPGKTLDQAQLEISAVTAQLRKAYPKEDSALGVRVVPLQHALLFSFETIRLILFGVAAAVVFVLLIACANVTNLSLARAVTRSREVAIRTALGASRGDLFRMCVAESAILTALGGALGILLAVWCDRLLDANIPQDLYRVGQISIDWRVALMLLGIFALTTLVIGSTPYLQLSRIDAVNHLRESSTTSTFGRRQKFLRNTLVIGQMAAALFLLIGAALVLESLLRLRNVDAGLSPDGVGVMDISLLGARYPTDAEKQIFYGEVLQKVAALPAVQSAALVYPLPLNFESDIIYFAIPGETTAEADKPRAATAFWVSADYFRVMGVPLRQGRSFTEVDTKGSPPVVIVNHSFAGRFWPGQDPLGKSLELEPGSKASIASVVGVAADSRDTDLSKIEPEVFVPILQKPLRTFRLVVRTHNDPTVTLPAIRQSIWSIDPDLALTGGRTMREVLADSTTPQRVAAMLLGILGMSALSLAVLGLYGVMAFLSRQRVQEISLRMALGARREQVLSLLLRQGLGLALIGMLVGLGAGILLGQLLSSVLYGVGSFSVFAFVGLPLLLLAVALIASLIPAHRATRADPVIALRQS